MTFDEKWMSRDVKCHLKEEKAGSETDRRPMKERGTRTATTSHEHTWSQK